MNCKYAIGAVRYHIRGWCAVVEHVEVKTTWKVAAEPNTTVKGKIAAGKQNSETNESFDFSRGEWRISALWHNGHQQSALGCKKSLAVLLRWD